MHLLKKIGRSVGGRNPHAIARQVMAHSCVKSKGHVQAELTVTAKSVIQWGNAVVC